MRLYTFNNMYLSSIQHGIQSAHVVHELFLNYADPNGSPSNKMLWDWANNHKTMIVTNGGYQSNLRSIAKTLERVDNPYPFASFYEESDSLNGCLTSVGVVLPVEVYGLVANMREQGYESTKEYLAGQIHDIPYGVVLIMDILLKAKLSN